MIPGESSVLKSDVKTTDFFFVILALAITGCNSWTLSIRAAPSKKAPDVTPSALGWVQSSPHNAPAVTASWTVSSSSDLVDQEIQFYSDGSCGQPYGTSLDFGSTATSTQALPAGEWACIRLHGRWDKFFTMYIVRWKQCAQCLYRSRWFWLWNSLRCGCGQRGNRHSSLCHRQCRQSYRCLYGEFSEWKRCRCRL